MRKHLWLISAIAVVVGCGGGGAGTSTGAATTPIAFYISDNLTPDYDQVWVSLNRVRLMGDKGVVTVFEDAAGKRVNVRALRDASGPRFLFLDDVRVPADTYREIEVIVGDDVALRRNGAATLEQRKFDDSHNAPGQAGKSRLGVPLAGFDAGANRHMVVDFDLANWSVNASGAVEAEVRRGDDSGLENESRHEVDSKGGRVGNLVGTWPNLTFTLLRGNGRNIAITTDESTKLFNQNGAPNPTLSNGTHVEVSGTFVDGKMRATSIMIEAEDENDDPHEIKGIVRAKNANAGTLQLDVVLAIGFTPDRSTYDVATTSSTAYLSNAGSILTKDEFFAAVAVGGQVEAEGRLSGGTLTATKLKLEDEDTNEVEATGTVGNITVSGFSLTIQLWQGAGLAQGDVVTVQVGSGTAYRIGKNDASKADFFAQLNQGDRVEVKGALQGNTIAAIRVKTED